MNKSVVLATLFLGMLVSVNKTDAAVRNANNFEGFQIAQNSPWDPREAESATDDTAKEGESLQADQNRAVEE